MSPKPTCVARGAPVADCARQMLVQDVRRLPVLADGRVIGLVTDWSVFQRGAFRGREWVPFDETDADLRVEHLARPVQVAARPAEPVQRVLRLLGHAFQDVAVVLDEDDRPVGMVDGQDALRLAVDLLDDDLWSTEGHPRQLTSVGRDAPARRCMAILVRQPGRHLLVTDNQALVGVLSFADLTRPGALDRTAGELLARTTPEYAVGAVPLRYAATVMLTQDIGCLPIVDRELRPLRILTRADLARAVLDTLDRDAMQERQRQRVLAAI